MVRKYTKPTNWITYNKTAILDALIQAKAGISTLVETPSLRSWTDDAQSVLLKEEVAGTSQIEGASLTDAELEEAVKEDSPTDLFTHSQRQVRAATIAYKWIAGLPIDYPMSKTLIQIVHRLIVTDCDADHCAPGQLRTSGENVIFGAPHRWRGAEGGHACEMAFNELLRAVDTEFHAHDELIQALTLHYHIGAMHPFLDGNGRTARALEALMLRKAGVTDGMFISMANFYNEEKQRYFECLSTGHSKNHDLTAFLIFGLTGIAVQCKKMTGIKLRKIGNMLGRELMLDLLVLTKNSRTRNIIRRQRLILRLLSHHNLTFAQLCSMISSTHPILKSIETDLVRDLTDLLYIEAISFIDHEIPGHCFFSARQKWSEELTKIELYRKYKDRHRVNTNDLSRQVRKARDAGGTIPHTVSWRDWNRILKVDEVLSA